MLTAEEKISSSASYYGLLYLVIYGNVEKSLGNVLFYCCKKATTNRGDLKKFSVLTKWRNVM